MSTVHNTAPPSRRRLILLSAIAVVCAAIAVVRWLDASRTKQRLETASLEELQTLAKQQPDNPQIFHFLGLRAQHVGAAPIALDAYGKAVQLAPDHEDDWLGWAAAARDVRGPQAADRVLETYLKQHPHSSRALLERARLYRTMEYHRTAYGYAQEAIKYDPTLVDAWGIMAEQAREFRDYPAAETAARRAIALAPKDWRCHLEMGQILLAEAHSPDAIAAFRKAAELAPERAGTHLNLGIGLLSAAQSASDLEAAQQSLIMAIRLQEQLGAHDRFRLALALGQSYQRQSQWNKALEPLQDAAKIEPGDETIHYALAQVYRGLGDKAHADTEARIHTDIAQYHAAIRYLLLQISGAPDNPAPRLKLARLYASRGNVIDAARTYKGMLSRGLAPKIAEQELQALGGAH